MLIFFITSTVSFNNFSQPQMNSSLSLFLSSCLSTKIIIIIIVVAFIFELFVVGQPTARIYCCYVKLNKLWQFYCAKKCCSYPCLFSVTLTDRWRYWNVLSSSFNEIGSQRWYVNANVFLNLCDKKKKTVVHKCFRYNNETKGKKLKYREIL